MKNTYTVFDAADYLETEADIKAFLDAALEGNDPQHIVQALGAVARARGMSKIAKKTGASRQSLYKALSGDGNPGFSTVLGVLNALGLKLRTA